MFYILSKILAFTLSPYYWMISFILMGIFLRNKVWKKRSFLAAVAVFFIFGNQYIINRLYQAIETPPLLQEQIKSPFEYGVVLGGGFAMVNPKLPDRVIFRNEVNRLTEAMELYQSGKLKKLIISGGAGGLSRIKQIEAEYIKTFLLENNWPDSVLLIDPVSLNTYQNAVNVKKILDSVQYQGPVLLITSALHMRRARACFDKQGIEVVPYAAAYEQVDKMDYMSYLEPSTVAMSEWTSILREWIGYKVYKLKGYL